MSLSPHQIFGRLQELKKWQETHEKLLQRSFTDEDISRGSIIRQRSYQNSENSNRNSLEKNEHIELNSSINPEDMYISPTVERNFEELLEEKLQEYNEYNVPINNTSVPKRPFLKKGAGLLKYNLKPEEYKNLIGNKYSNSALLSRERPKSVEVKKKIVHFQTERPKTTGSAPKSAKKPLNSVKPCRTSVNSGQKPKTGKIDYSRRNEIQNRQNKNKILNTSEQNKRISNGQKLNRGGDFSNEKPPQTKSNVRFHPEEPIYNDKVVETNKTNSVEIPEKEIKSDKFESTKKCTPKLHDFIENLVKKPLELTPLKAPEISIKPKGNWCDVSGNDSQNEVWKFENNDRLQQNDRNFSNDKYTAQAPVQSNWKNGYTQEVNERNRAMPEIETSNNASVKGDPPARKSLSYESNDNSLYEKALETELKIFEALERRTEQSGFSSTNTSIIQLLASTPSRFNFKNSEVNTQDSVSERIIDSRDAMNNESVRDNIKQKFEDVKSNYLDKILMAKFENMPNWHTKPDDNSDKYQPEESEEEYETEEEPDETIEEDPSKNDEETNENMEDFMKSRRDSSVNTDDILILPSSYSSTSDISDDYSIETSRTYRSSKPMTEPKTLDSTESCSSCGFLIKNKVEECQSELNILKEEKNRIIAIREQMLKDKKEFEKDMKLRRKQFEEQKLKYEREIEEERKKMAEKCVSEKPNKDIKSKTQQRKDKEEINNLRMELSETKELMKLRETKNAMIIARLRNQIKVLEKNNSELKLDNEKLIKEKSKLVAQQKTFNKTTETKMLKEISKNISKLTEETIKNQTFKVDTSSEDNVQKKSVKPQKDSRKSLNLSQGILKNYGQGEAPIEDYEVEHTTPNIIDNNIEEKYKSLFGGNDVIIEENRKNMSVTSANTSRNAGLGKTERILEDGTKEIKYTNGNVKRISENGTVRYYYSSNDTWHTNFPDGTEVIEFPNGQSEKRFKDGKCLIFFPDGLIQAIYPDGTEEVKYPDGSKLVTRKDGDRMLFLSNGQVEIHTKDQKRREYPDGTVKILYPDGSQETRYSNGRVRMKNSKGDIVLDTGEANS